MSNMSRGRKAPSQQNLRNPENRVKSKVKQKGMHLKKKRLRSSTRDYSEGKEPSGATGKIPLVRGGGESGQFIEDGKSVTYADKKNKGMKKRMKK